MTATYVIVQRSEDGTGYYTGGRFAGWAFDLEDAKRYTTKAIARRMARRINEADKEYGAYLGTATVRECR